MSNLVLTDNTKFPVGATVGAYPEAASHHGQVFGAALETAVVQVDGSVTFTTLTDGVSYALAIAGSSPIARIRSIKASVSVAGTTWKARIAARRAAAGTS